MSVSVDASIFGLVLAGRLLLPLLIFKYPLPGILACLALDAVDQTIFQQWTELDLSGYQSYDKALDIFYLVMAYLATMRNWRSASAFLISMVLLYYRLAGVTAFELTEARYRFLLLIFPNTFEYFFIFYELVRTRWDPRRRSPRFWLASAAVIWICIKLPQEFWIHVAQFDFTDAVADHPWFGGLVLAVFVAMVVVFMRWVRPTLPAPDHFWRLGADPVPEPMRRQRQRNLARVAKGTVLDLQLLEKVTLVSLVTILFASIIPQVTASPMQIVLGSAVLVVANSALGLYRARRGLGYDDLLVSFVMLVAVNVSLVLTADILRPRGTSLDVPITLFYILLLSLIVILYDRYRPVHETLGQQDRALAPAPSGG